MARSDIEAVWFSTLQCSSSSDSLNMWTCWHVCQRQDEALKLVHLVRPSKQCYQYQYNDRTLSHLHRRRRPQEPKQKQCRCWLNAAVAAEARPQWEDRAHSSWEASQEVFIYSLLDLLRLTRGCCHQQLPSFCIPWVCLDPVPKPSELDVAHGAGSLLLQLSMNFKQSPFYRV